MEPAADRAAAQLAAQQQQPLHRATTSGAATSSELARLLIETDELLSAIDPTVFPLTPTTESPKVSSDTLAITAASTSRSASARSSSRRRVARGADAGDSSVATTSWKTTGAARRNPSRERMQRELVDLRAQVAQLDQQLQDARSEAKCGGAAGVLALVGRRTAKRQKELRERSEAENKRLKSQLDAQNAFATEMQRVLLSWQQAATPSTADPRTSLVPFQRVCIESEDSALFKALLAELDEAHRQTAALFEASRFDYKANLVPFTSSTEKKERLCDGSSRSCLEYVSIGVTPFAFRVNRSVAWRCVKQHHLSRSNCARFSLPYDDYRDTFAVKYRAKQTRGGVDECIDSLFAMRRYESEEQEVWIWRGVSTSEQYTRDIRVDETGWTEMTKLEAATSSPRNTDSSVAGTVMKSCVRYETTHLNASRRHSSPDAAAVTMLVVSSYEEDLVEMVDTMEGMLIEESRAMST